MFWSLNSCTNSAIDTLLDQPDVTLEEVLDQDETLQECRLGNKRLSEFLLRPENLDWMLDIITKEPSTELQYWQQYTMPNRACEVMTSDVAFPQKLAAEKPFLEKLFHFFRDSPVDSINPILASFVSRVLSDIITRKPDHNWYSYQLNILHLLNYLDTTENVSDWLLAHLGTAAVRELLFKLVMHVEGHDMRANLIQWLKKDNFLYRVIQKLEKGARTVHENVCQLLTDVLDSYLTEVSCSQDKYSEDDPFFLSLPSAGAIYMILTTVLDQEEICESSVEFGLTLILELLGIPFKPQKVMDHSEENNGSGKCFIHPKIQNAILSRFGRLKEVLKKMPKPMKVPSGGRVKYPIGLARLSVVRFLAQLASLRKAAYLNHMVRTGLLDYVMEMWFHNDTNGFFHQAMERLIVSIFRTEEENMAVPFLMYKDKSILELMQQTFEPEGTRFLLSEQKWRRGLNITRCPYRGQLGKIATVIAEERVRLLDYPVNGVRPEHDAYTDAHLWWSEFNPDGLDEYWRRCNASLKKMQDFGMERFMERASDPNEFGNAFEESDWKWDEDLAVDTSNKSLDFGCLANLNLGNRNQELGNQDFGNQDFGNQDFGNQDFEAVDNQEDLFDQFCSARASGDFDMTFK